MDPPAFQRCIDPECGATYDVGEALVACRRCGALLDVAYEWDRLRVPRSFGEFDGRRGSFAPLDFSGVWRFRELLPFYGDESPIHTIGEGRTILQTADLLARELGLAAGTLHLQYEGFNPSGSFKDNGMTAAFTHARMAGARRVACASTGNTSASLALYAAQAGLPAIVFVGGGKIALGKLGQALDHGALTLQIEGDFDACLRRLRQVAEQRRELGLYLMNSINPFRLEGQKTIVYRILEARAWRAPDWLVVPGGNLGNAAAFGKAFAELLELGLIDRLPRLAVINATGANTLYKLYEDDGLRWNGGRFDREAAARLYAGYDESGHAARTIASAIEIARPVNLPKALRTLETMHGVVRQVSDEEMLDARALVARFGFGCEPASAASVAGLRRLMTDGTVGRGEQVVCVLTGHELKDANVTVDYHLGERAGRYGNRPVRVADDLESIIAAIDA